MYKIKKICYSGYMQREGDLYKNRAFAVNSAIYCFYGVQKAVKSHALMFVFACLCRFMQVYADLCKFFAACFCMKRRIGALC